MSTLLRNDLDWVADELREKVVCSLYAARPMVRGAPKELPWRR